MTCTRSCQQSSYSFPAIFAILVARWQADAACNGTITINVLTELQQELPTRLHPLEQGWGAPPVSHSNLANFTWQACSGLRSWEQGMAREAANLIERSAQQARFVVDLLNPLAQAGIIPVLVQEIP